MYSRNTKTTIPNRPPVIANQTCEHLGHLKDLEISINTCKIIFSLMILVNNYILHVEQVCTDVCERESRWVLKHDKIEREQILLSLLM